MVFLYSPFTSNVKWTSLICSNSFRNQLMRVHTETSNYNSPLVGVPPSGRMEYRGNWSCSDLHFPAELVLVTGLSRVIGSLVPPEWELVHIITVMKSWNARNWNICYAEKLNQCWVSQHDRVHSLGFIIRVLKSIDSLFNPQVSTWCQLLNQTCSNFHISR